MDQVRGGERGTTHRSSLPALCRCIVKTCWEASAESICRGSRYQNRETARGRMSAARQACFRSHPPRTSGRTPTHVVPQEPAPLVAVRALDVGVVRLNGLDGEDHAREVLGRDEAERLVEEALRFGALRALPTWNQRTLGEDTAEKPNKLRGRRTSESGRFHPRASLRMAVTQTALLGNSSRSVSRNELVRPEKPVEC